MCLANKMHQNYFSIHFLLCCQINSDATNARLWTLSNPTRLDDQGIIYSFSRIDDILLSDFAETCKPCYTCDLGYLRDHIPLMGIIPTNMLTYKK